MKKWLLLTVFLAFLLRTINLSTLPSGFTPDEASFGYDAYSILKTGKDQWGHRFPLVLESFGDFKPPLYAYLAIPFVATLGLNEFTVRLPNALLGTAAVYVLFLLVEELQLFFKYSRNERDKYSSLPLIAAVFLAVSPWHIMMSRGAFEANLTTFFIPLGIWSFLKSIHGKQHFLILSAIAFGLSLFTYHSAKLVTPLILVTLVVLYRGELQKMKKKYRISSLLLVGLFIGLTVYTFTKGAGTRASDVSVLSGAMEAAAAPRLSAIESGMNPLMAKTIHNQYLLAAKRFVSNYSQYFSVKFLLTTGPAEATYGMIPGIGVLYWFDVLFVLSFLYVSLKKKALLSRELLVVLIWILLSPIPAALTTGAGYAGNRAVVMAPSLIIITSIGALQIATYLREIYILKFLSAGVFVISVLILVNAYVTRQPIEGGEAMLYGRKEMVNYLSSEGYDPFSHNVVIDKRLSEPQMHIAFYMKLDPHEYQQWTKNWIGYKQTSAKFVDQLDEYEMENYLFTTNFLEKRERLSDYVQVGKPVEFDSDVKPNYTIRYPNGDIAIYIVEPLDDIYAFSSVSSEQ